MSKTTVNSPNPLTRFFHSCVSAHLISSPAGIKEYSIPHKKNWNKNIKRYMQIQSCTLCYEGKCKFSMTSSWILIVLSRDWLRINLESYSQKLIEYAKSINFIMYESYDVITFYHLCKQLEKKTWSRQVFSVDLYWRTCPIKILNHDNLIIWS